MGRCEEPLDVTYIAIKQKQKSVNLEPCTFFEVEDLIFQHFSKIWKFNNPCDVKKSKLGQKGAKFVYYIPTAIKKWNCIAMSFSRLVIHFWDQFVKTVIYGPFLILVLTSFKIRSKEAHICRSSKAIGNEKFWRGKCLWS